MDELVNLVSEKTGLPEEMSRQSVGVVLDYLKKQRPDPLVSVMDNVLSGNAELGLEDVAKELSNAFKFP